MKKSNSPVSGLNVDHSSNDYREFAETFRASACLVRHSVNVALNVPVGQVLTSKEVYDKFLSTIDYLQGMYFKFYEAYMKCADDTLEVEKKSHSQTAPKETAKSAVKS